MTESGGVHNENSGKVSGVSFQARDVHGNVTLQHQAAGADELLAGSLADAVRELSRKEEDHWRIGDPAPLSVRWHSAEQDLFDYWENIQASPQRADPVSLSGEFTTIRETFKATGSQRLLVLGRAGAGKTVLAHRLVLDLLEHRDYRAPVPVLFSLSDWNPITTGLRDWMANRLVRDHPFLAQHDVTGKRSAELLVDRDWVLPVLDGFDELPEQHHRAAITEISRVRWPLMVTSRTAEYAQAAREVKAVGRAAAIELEDLTLEQTEQYLRRSSKPSRATEWEGIFEYLRTEPATVAGRNLAPVVTTPLMVMLARATYNDANENSPRELLDTTRFPDRDDLEQHLLGRYVDTVYTAHHAIPSGATVLVWDPEQVRRWLGYLAARLQSHGTHDLTWWQLPTLLRRRTRIFATTITYGLMLGIAYLAVEAFAYGFEDWLTDFLKFGRMHGGSDFEVALPIRLGLGLTLGLGLGLTLALINEKRISRREPERIRLRRRRSIKHSALTSSEEAARGFVLGLGIGLTLGLVGGLVYGPVYGLVFGFTHPDGDGIAVILLLGPLVGIMGGMSFGIMAGLVVGVTMGIVNAVVSSLGESLSPQEGTISWQLLSTDRTVTLARVTVSVVTITLVAYPLAAPIISGAIAVASFFGVMGGALQLALSAWGNWLLFARLLLPLSRRFPWRPKRFLEDAYRRGVLRQAGSVYQFRHTRLRDHLAAVNESG